MCAWHGETEKSKKRHLSQQRKMPDLPPNNLLRDDESHGAPSGALHFGPGPRSRPQPRGTPDRDADITWSPTAPLAPDHVIVSTGTSYRARSNPRCSLLLGCSSTLPHCANNSSVPIDSKAIPVSRSSFTASANR